MQVGRACFGKWLWALAEKFIGGRMTYDIADEILNHVTDYAVGFVQRVEGVGGKVAGSGVLVSIEGRKGILTCGHVAEVYSAWSELGLIRFAARQDQRMVLKLADTHTVMIQSGEKWSRDGHDLAFMMLPPEIASSIGAQSLFLNVELNRTRLHARPSSQASHFDSILGLVEEWSQPSFVEGGRLISPVQATLHNGHLVQQEDGLLIIDALEYNIPDLPKNFGGMSGGGLWRTYYSEDAVGKKSIQTVLIGVASWQIDDRKIACQGWNRIDGVLIPLIRTNLKLS